MLWTAGGQQACSSIMTHSLLTKETVSQHHLSPQVPRYLSGGASDAMVLLA